jgi:hypothetical protein
MSLGHPCPKRFPANKRTRMAKMKSMRRPAMIGSGMMTMKVDKMKEMKTYVSERVSNVPPSLRLLALIGLATRGY